MALRRKWMKAAIALLALLAIAQLAAGVLVRTSWMHAYLVSHLERAFGRQVEVRQFDAQFFPSLRLDAIGVSVAEDPSFGRDYFLRAEKLTAGLRWGGLMHGHFEFGALTLRHPSVMLVRNAQGRWNLEDWLPPAKGNTPASLHIYGPPPLAGTVNRLVNIEFEEGRINFKQEQDMLPFAFIEVNGMVEQISAGRWQLQLAAQPWRSGVSLQSPGTLQVSGDIAGTSARLQPARLEMHWTGASIADLLRLARGQDYGVRGSFSLDAVAQSGIPGAVPAEGPRSPKGFSTESPSDWTFTLQARGASIHRWDLTERTDNPRLTLNVAGRGNIAARTFDATELSLQSPDSNLRGTLHIASAAPDLRVDSAGIQARDVLAWYRAFDPGTDEKLRVDQYFTGSARIVGWPPKVDHLAFSSYGGAINIPGLGDPIYVGAVRGGCDQEKLVLEPVHVHLGGERNILLAAAKRRAITSLHNAADVSAAQDLSTHEGGVVLEAQIDQFATVLRASSAIGRPINHGWELNGRAQGQIQWDWNLPRGQRWSGKVVVSKGRLAVAGLNQQLQVENAAYALDHGKASVLLGEVDGFGTTWSGSILENRAAAGEAHPLWNFNLRTGSLDAAEIDRWVGPRARPGWLRSLLSSLGGAPSSAAPVAVTDVSNANPTTDARASELLRRLDAEGTLTVDVLTVEKLKFENVRASGRLLALQLEAREVEAQWAGGKVHAQLTAKFAPRPSYDIVADVDGAHLALMPLAPGISDQWAGVASGSMHLTTHGVGREGLLQNLAGRGKISVANLELRGWDVAASALDGVLHTGTSRWSAGSGIFELQNRKITLDNLRLDGGKQWTLVNGTVDFARETDLQIRVADSSQPILRTAVASRTLRVSGPMDAPRLTIDVTTARNVPFAGTTSAAAKPASATAP
ncbi:MAG TPA: AsmA family protein [Candidatus Dormibacteraeota bacterium]|nr:AsmA family protein [Candidatus Dormibacteraeota bacterium]